MEHRLALIENAVDSLNEALTKYEMGAHGGEPRELKFAVLHMAHFIELLLKERMAKIHPLLIYERPFEAKIRYGRTISVSQAINFLRHAEEIEDDFHDNLRWLTDLRNQITHREFVIDVVHTKETLGRIVKAAVDFCDPALSQQIRASLPKQVNATLQDLLDDYTERLRLAQSNAEEHSDQFGPYTDEYGHIMPVGPLDCGSCGSDQTVAASGQVKSREPAYGQCFFCEQEGRITQCGHCSDWYPDWDLVKHPMTDEPSSICEACADWWQHRWDDD